MSKDISVINELIDCPQCGFPAQEDDYYIVGDKRITCEWCGYQYSLINNHENIVKGYGSVHYCKVIKETKQTSQYDNKIIRYTTPLSLIERNNIIKNIYEKNDVQHSKLFVWNDDTCKLESLHGSLPKTLDEQYQAEYEEQLAYKSCMHTYGNNTDTVDFQ